MLDILYPIHTKEEEEEKINLHEEERWTNSNEFQKCQTIFKYW